VEKEQKELWEEKVKELLNQLGWHDCRNLDLYQEALTHSSYAHEKNGELKHNERLEYLGDAVLELVVSDYLYRNYPHYPEGKLTKFRSDLVCKDSLVQIALKLNLGDYLRLGKGEASGGGHTRPSLLADAVEALIGALYLDMGFKKCYSRVIEMLKMVAETLDEEELRRDYKTLLQEYVQSHFGVTPVYRMTGESGPDHAKVFHSEVLINGEVFGKGSGKNKKEAQQDAARQAWEQMS